MKNIVYMQSNGVLAIVRPAARAMLPGETEGQFLARIVEKAVPADATGIRIIESDDIPADRTFRDAWTTELVVDMPKAREIHRERLRGLRAPLLKALDIEYQRADELRDDDKKREITAKKQALRDVTDDPAIAAAQTPEQLAAVMPAALEISIKGVKR